MPFIFKRPYFHPYYVISSLCKESRENLVEKKKRETTRTKNINILFLRSCIHYNSKSKSNKNLLNEFFVDWDRFHLRA